MPVQDFPLLYGTKRFLLPLAGIAVILINCYFHLPRLRRYNLRRFRKPLFKAHRIIDDLTRIIHLQFIYSSIGLRAIIKILARQNVLRRAYFRIYSLALLHNAE